jgi:hypothetical protein
VVIGTTDTPWSAESEGDDRGEKTGGDELPTAWPFLISFWYCACCLVRGGQETGEPKARLQTEGVEEFVTYQGVVLLSHLDQL